jgi:hypothetical protein
MNDVPVSLVSLYQEIEKLSLFDIRQLRYAMLKLVEDPDRLLAAKRHLKVGMTVSYLFSDDEGMKEAIILKISDKRVIVKNLCDGRQWNIYVSTINLYGKDLLVSPKRFTGNLDRHSLKIGDLIGFHERKSGIDLYGKIKKLNPKRALVELHQGGLWYVYYSNLFLITEGESRDSNGCLLIEGEVI